MPNTSPYQPALLRILHGAAAVLTISALVSGFWVYNTYDKRWGRLALPTLEDIQGIHGTIALTFLLFLPIFALYSLRIGYRRLVQEQSFSQLSQVGKPVWWISLHRFANTLMLIAATFSVITGRMMKEVATRRRDRSSMVSSTFTRMARSAERSSFTPANGG
jgi:hypothetical protein